MRAAALELCYLFGGRIEMRAAVVVVVESGNAELLRCIGLAAAYLFNPTAFLYVLSMPSLTPHSKTFCFIVSCSYSYTPFLGIW